MCRLYHTTDLLSTKYSLVLRFYNIFVDMINIIMKINDIITEAISPQVRDLYKTLKKDNIPQKMEIDPDDETDKSQLGKDYKDKTKKVMGWNDSKIRNRSTTDDNSDDSYYEKSTQKIRDVVDELKKFADNEGLELKVDRWNNNKNWAIGLILSNNRSFRINFKPNGDIRNLDFNFPKGSDQTDTIKIIDSMLSKNPEYKISSTNYTTQISKTGGKITIEDYKNMVKKFETMISDPDVAKSLSIKQVTRSKNAGSLINRNVTQTNYYIGVATMIYVAVRFGLKNIIPRGGKDGTSTGTFDLNDKGITVGISAAGRELVDAGKRPYREHAVPCDFIIKKAIEMIKSSRSNNNNSVTDPTKLIDTSLIGEVAKMIKRNLVIVLISPEERKEVDKDYQTTMPEGDSWDPQTGDVLSRLKSKGIRIYSLDGNSRLSEDNLE